MFPGHPSSYMNPIEYDIVVDIHIYEKFMSSLQGDIYLKLCEIMNYYLSLYNVVAKAIHETNKETKLVPVDRMLQLIIYHNAFCFFLAHLLDKGAIIDKNIKDDIFNRVSSYNQAFVQKLPEYSVLDLNLTYDINPESNSVLKLIYDELYKHREVRSDRNVLRQAFSNDSLTIAVDKKEFLLMKTIENMLSQKDVRDLNYDFACLLSMCQLLTADKNSVRSKRWKNNLGTVFFAFMFCSRSTQLEKYVANIFMPAFNFAIEQNIETISTIICFTENERTTELSAVWSSQRVAEFAAKHRELAPENSDQSAIEIQPM